MSSFPSPSRTGYPTSSATARVMEQLALYGHHATADEPDPRPLPENTEVDALIQGLFEGLVGPLLETSLEPDLPDLLWSLVDVFHRKSARVQRQLDDNEDRQRQAQAEQDGSEIRSVDLERLTTKGQALLERRETYERMRDQASERYELHTGTAWRPRSGSMVNHKALTAAMIDSRDFIAAKRRSETELMLPPGPKIGFAGGTDCQDHLKIWSVLDKVLAKHPGMVLVHGGSPRGAERIAACWADNRKVTHVPFKPDWARDGKSAPFKRNDRLLELLPIGVVVFPGSGITDNIADKAKQLGIPVCDYRNTGR